MADISKLQNLYNMQFQPESVTYVDSYFFLITYHEFYEKKDKKKDSNTISKHVSYMLFLFLQGMNYCSKLRCFNSISEKDYLQIDMNK